MRHLTHSNCLPDRGMHNAKIAENVNDRELFSEPLEPPINPLLIHMVPPFMNVKGPMFCLQINGEVIWESRKVYSYPRMTFYLCKSFAFDFCEVFFFKSVHSLNSIWNLKPFYCVILNVFSKLSLGIKVKHLWQL